nr:hypothetical protein HK105_002111 [Polyrhizophydium stewartii]
MSKISKKKREMQVLAVSGEMQGIILSLRDMCIKLIADRIEDVEQFGDIPYASKRKISKIISRQRQLNNRTVQLFLGADEEMVELFDCTLLDEDGLISVAMLCPNVRVLTLGLCGRATDAVLEHIGSHCPAIEALTLRGPFLPTNHGFSAMFSGLGPSLRELVLEHAAKLSEPALRVLREAAPALRVLSLTACTAVGDDAMEHIAALAELESLELNGLGSGVSVASLLDLVDKLGPQLTTLSLNGYELLDDTVVDRIATVCQTLTVLSLSECPKVTPEGLTSSLTRLTTRHPDGMHTLLLNRNVQLTDAVLATAVNQFSPTLARLGINGLDELSEAAMQAVAASCTALVEVDLSWIRSLADGALETLLTRAHSLERVRVFGCHELSQAVLNRTWRNADGRVIEIQGNEFD